MGRKNKFEWWALIAAILTAVFWLYCFVPLISKAAADPSDREGFGYFPELDKKEIFVILKEFDDIDALKSHYKNYRQKWIAKNPNIVAPAENVLAFSSWGVWEDANGDIDYCIIWIVKPSPDTIEQRSYEIGHEALHCFKGKYH